MATRGFNLLHSFLLRNEAQSKHTWRLLPWEKLLERLPWERVYLERLDFERWCFCQTELFQHAHWVVFGQTSCIFYFLPVYLLWMLIFDDASVDLWILCFIFLCRLEVHGARYNNFIYRFHVSLFLVQLFTPPITRLENQIGLLKLSLSLVACCVFLLVSWIVSNVFLSLCPVFVLPRLVLFYSSSIVFPFMWLMKRARACALRIYQILPLFGDFLFSQKAKTHRTWARQGLLVSSCIQKHIFSCSVL